MALTAKQQRFVAEYLKDLNGTQAAIRAGYSPKTANEQAARLLANVSVRSSVDEAIAQRSARTEIDADWVLKRLAQGATADLADLYDEHGEPRIKADAALLTPNIRPGIGEIEMRGTGKESRKTRCLL